MSSLTIWACPLKMYPTRDHRKERAMNESGIPPPICNHIFRDQKLCLALNDIMIPINFSHDVDEIFHKVMEESCKALGCESARIVMREFDNWVTRYVSNLSDELIGRSFTDEELPHAALAMTTRKPVIIDDAYHDYRTNNGMMETIEIRSVLVFPLIEMDVVTGAMMLDYHSRVLSFSETEIDYAERMTTGIAIAIQNARLRQELEESKRLGVALSQIDAMLYSTQDYDVIMNKMLQLATDAIGAETAVIFSKEGDRWVVRNEYKLPVLLIGKSFSNTEVMHTAITVETKRSLVVQDVLNNPEIDQKFVEMLGIRSLLDFPLILKGEVIGDLTFHYHSRPVSFNEIQVEFVRKLQTAISLALENIRLLDTYKQNESKLKEAEKLGKYGYFNYDVATHRTTWSEGVFHIFGSDSARGELSVKKFFKKHSVDPGFKAMQRLVRNNEISEFDAKIHHDDLTSFVHFTIHSAKDEQGHSVNFFGTIQDITERKQLEEIIKHQAQHDTLTGLPNRQLFLDLLSLELIEAHRHGKKLALLFLDLNGFKQVNDTLGHSCGDLLLQEVAKRLRASVRESDTVARLGGDEFTVLMPDLGRTEDVGHVLRKILGVFETPFMLGDSATESTTSIGISMFPDDGKTSEELMKKADIAMYDAKGLGKNSYQFYNAEINSRTIKRRKMEEFLRQAVGRGELELLFQPLVNSDTRGIIGAEALLRWRHPEQGLLAPDQFLSIAEDCGAIVPIGEWVIRNACVQARTWNEKGFPLSVSVNLSNRQFHQSNLVEKTALILAETGLMPHQLEFDITEKTIMADVGFSHRSMQALTAMGVTINIDNFGCESSSIKWINKMPIQKVKIDKSFVMTILTEPDDLAVVNAVIALSHNLKMKVIANGVETEEHMSVIRQSGCDQLQGYVISEPLMPAEFERLVANY